MMTSSNGLSPQNGCTQPPRRKSLVGSSSGPPGACMTPSSEMKTAAASLRIDGFSVSGGLYFGDVDLAHRHHRLKRALAALTALAGQLEQASRRDLPGKAPLVLAPAARAFLAAAGGDRVPVAVGFFLIVGQDHEADRLIGLEVGAAVQADEGTAEDGELDCQLLALLAARKVRHGAVCWADMAVGEDRCIELGRLCGFAFVEPEAGDHLVGHAFLRELIGRLRASVAPGPCTAANSSPATKMK